MKQSGLFGEDFEPGKWSAEELEEIRKLKIRPSNPKENQPDLFDVGRNDLPGQLTFEDNE